MVLAMSAHASILLQYSSLRSVASIACKIWIASSNYERDEAQRAFGTMRDLVFWCFLLLASECNALRASPRVALGSTRWRPVVLQAEETPSPTDETPADDELARKQAEIDEYKARQAELLQQDKAKIKERFGGFSFDFSGEQSVPTAARGKGGLNEQGYGSSEVNPVPDKGAFGLPVYAIGLGLAAVATVALSINSDIVG